MSDRAQPQYVLGHSTQEMDRLAIQAAVLRPITERLLRSAGLAEGMRVLDVGCGAGDVSILAAELVGPSGAVMGIDTSADALARARDRASASGIGNIKFHQRDMFALHQAASFDAVIGRYILIHMLDPAEAVRHVSTLTKPGGVIAFHEIDLKTPPRSNPLVAEWDQACGWVIDVFGKMLSHPDTALRLTEHFRQAGLPAPVLFCEVPLANSADPAISSWVANTVLTLKARMIDVGLFDAALLDDRLAEQFYAAMSQRGAQLIAPAQICAWTRIP